jgi:hypothetical protein
VFFVNQSWNFKFHQNLRREVGALRKGLCTFVITSRWVLVRLRNVSDKSCRENENTHFMFNNFWGGNPCHLWDNADKYFRAREAKYVNKIGRMCFAWWINNAADRHSEYNTLLFHGKRLREHVLFLFCFV